MKAQPSTGLVIGGSVSHKFKPPAPATGVTFQSARELMHAQTNNASTPRTLDSFGFVKRAAETNPAGTKRPHEVIDLDDEPPFKRAKTTHVPATPSTTTFRSISGKFSNK
jgi:hypothetical protein